jgi:hypothetical protein
VLDVGLLSGKLPRLTSLKLSGHAFTLSATDFPALERLDAIVQTDLVGLVRGLVAGSWPKLRHLVLALGSYDRKMTPAVAGEVVELLVDHRKRFAGLKSLELCVRATTVTQLRKAFAKVKVTNEHDFEELKEEDDASFDELAD